MLLFLLNMIQKYFLKKKQFKNGYLSGSFLIGYGIIRFLIEFTREPDAQLGFFFSWLTMGQLLCVLMILGGLFVFWKIKNDKVVKLFS